MGVGPSRTQNTAKRNMANFKGALGMPAPMAQAHANVYEHARASNQLGKLDRSQGGGQFFQDYEQQFYGPQVMGRGMTPTGLQPGVMGKKKPQGQTAWGAAF